MQDVITSKKEVTNERLLRLRIIIHGAVQGVGFRPFVYRLALDSALKGWVNNTTQGVVIEIEGDEEQVQKFLSSIQREKPRHAIIQSLETSYLEPKGFIGFEILKSDGVGKKSALILPDIATCPECLSEILDPKDRRYLYPFTNCTNCGPRFSIIESLPYDRQNTTMKKFQMCDQCREEYENSLNRRYHAQPNACPKCGPQLYLWDARGKELATQREALLAATKAIREGAIVAVKGLGGFHLMVDGRNEEAVQALRQRKHREEKPFALMFPSLEMIENLCEVSKLEERLLLSPAGPIVLLQRDPEIPIAKSEIADSVAPKNPYLGLMLPYTPLHHIIMKELEIPVVATSGNLSDEPICTDEHEALKRLKGIADLFLVHNRPIVRHVDDSIVRVMAGRELVIRRARGYAPLPVEVKRETPPVLAVGAHLKNTIAASVKKDIFISQHIGDLETTQAYEAFQKVIYDFQRLYDQKPKYVACDAHPDYLSTQFAGESGLRKILVQHHYAHVLACMAENELDGPVLGVSWDGTGYGLDGTIWGGEFLEITRTSFERVAHLRTFRLPGGEKAIQEPRRAAIGLLYEIFGDDLFSIQHLLPVQAFSCQEINIMKNMLQKSINTPATSSAGRLFDAVASIIGLKQQTKFEGQAAMKLEFALEGFDTNAIYKIRIANPIAMGNGKLKIRDSKPESIVIDWAPMVYEIFDDMNKGMPTRKISAKFHNALVEAIVRVAKIVNQERVVMTGGCFQNKYLTERAIRRLREERFVPYWHQRIPPNDGGIALGQIISARREINLSWVNPE